MKTPKMTKKYCACRHNIIHAVFSLQLANVGPIENPDDWVGVRHMCDPDPSQLSQMSWTVGPPAFLATPSST